MMMKEELTRDFKQFEKLTVLQKKTLIIGFINKITNAPLATSYLYRNVKNIIAEHIMVDPKFGEQDKFYIHAMTVFGFSSTLCIFI